MPTSSNLKTSSRCSRTTLAQLESELNKASGDAMKQQTSAAEYNIVAAEVDSLAKYDSDLGLRIRELSPLSDEAMVNVSIVEDATRQRRAEGGAQSRDHDVPRNLRRAGARFAAGDGTRLARSTPAQAPTRSNRSPGLPVLGVIPHIQGAARSSQRAAAAAQRPDERCRRRLPHGPDGGVLRRAGGHRQRPSSSPRRRRAKARARWPATWRSRWRRRATAFCCSTPTSENRRSTRSSSIDRSIGLSNVLAGNQTLDEAIRPTPVSGLDVLPCGPIPANPSEILNSQMFADVLAELSERYDHVLLDSPPVMPVTDARILAASCGCDRARRPGEKTHAQGGDLRARCAAQRRAPIARRRRQRRAATQGPLRLLLQRRRSSIDTATARRRARARRPEVAASTNGGNGSSAASNVSRTSSAAASKPVMPTTVKT